MSCRLPRLTRRQDFVRLTRSGRHMAMPGLVLQCARRPTDISGDLPRVGFTASRRIGGAVVRNRARRRLRAAAGAVMPASAAVDRDYVLIARRTTAERGFADLVADLEHALARLGALRPAAQ